ncbi:hypothetical protein ACFQZC_24645 [Streptacidiphilus monticola]
MARDHSPSAAALSPAADEPGRTVQQSAPPPRTLPTRLLPAVPALLALLMGLWHLTTPGMWRDEAASFSAAQRSSPTCGR